LASGKHAEVKGKTMTPIIILDFVNLFFAGLLAGIEFVIHYGFRAPAEVLDERAQLQFRQAMVLRLRVLVPAFFFPTALTGLAVTVLNGGVSGFWLRVVGMLAMLLWIMIRVVGTVGINSDTLTWQLDAPPTNWKARVDSAERYHNVGVWAVILTFTLFLTAMALQFVVS